MKNLEEKLSNVDFSKNSRIENALLLKLLSKRKGQSMSMNDLDMVAAAGKDIAKRLEFVEKSALEKKFENK